jgi:vanadium-dependent haloperoxidase-like protein
MKLRTLRIIPLAAALLLVAPAGAVRSSTALLPPGNTVAQWNKIAEDTVIASGAFQNEGLLYMGYTSAAVYDAVVSIRGGYKPYRARIAAPQGASAEAAVIEAAYRTLVNYFPSQTTTLDPLYAEALGSIPDGAAKTAGMSVGLTAANNLIGTRSADGRQAPYGVSSPAFPASAPDAAGEWRRTPPFAAPQTPWVGAVRPFVLQAASQFLPAAPPSLSSSQWAAAFDEIKLYGQDTSSARTTDQAATARFWTANVIRQYNRAWRELADARGLGLLKSARLAAMVNVIGADAQISVMNAKYHYDFWRPVTAIAGSVDPAAVSALDAGPVPGFADGNSATAEQAGWRPLITTPNHPEYPAAHGSLTSAMAEVFAAFLGTRRIDLDIHGFDPNGTAGNLDAVRHFDKVGRLTNQIVNARLWAGLHYRFSGKAGVKLGQDVARYDASHAFLPLSKG